MTTALSGVALLVRRAANDRVIRQQHPARKYAMVACNHHPGIPSTHFVSFARAILYRDAGFVVVWPHFLAVAAIGGLFFVTALFRFRLGATQV
jgi:hypothetical protein